MRTLKDKKALITGAASGIGRETAIQLADAGAKIVALDVNELLTTAMPAFEDQVAEAGLRPAVGEAVEIPRR